MLQALFLVLMGLSIELTPLVAAEEKYEGISSYYSVEQNKMVVPLKIPPAESRMKFFMETTRLPKKVCALIMQYDGIRLWMHIPCIQGASYQVAVGGTIVGRVFRQGVVFDATYLQVEEKFCESVDWSRLSNAMFASLSYDNRAITLWDARAMKEIRVAPQNLLGTHIARLSKHRIAVARFKGYFEQRPRAEIRIYDLREKSCLRILAVDDYAIDHLHSLSPGLLVAATQDGIKLWNVRRGRCRKMLNRPLDEEKGREQSSNALKAMVVFPPIIIASVSQSDSSTIQLWDTRSLICTRTLRGHKGFIQCLEKVGASLLASGGSDCSIRIWDVEQGCCVKQLESPDLVTSLLWLPRQRSLLSTTCFTASLWSCAFHERSAQKQKILMLRAEEAAASGDGIKKEGPVKAPRIE